MEIITQSAEETKILGRKIASDLTSWKNPPNARILALSGGLGSGKTTFVQGLAESLGADRVISPTFILMRKYDVNPSTLFHLDLYRLEGDIWDEVKSLGIEEIWTNPENIVVIEWAERIKDKIPKSSMWIEFESLDDEKRRIIVNN